MLWRARERDAMTLPQRTPSPGATITVLLPRNAPPAERLTAAREQLGALLRGPDLADIPRLARFKLIGIELALYELTDTLAAPPAPAWRFDRWRAGLRLRFRAWRTARARPASAEA